MNGRKGAGCMRAYMKYPGSKKKTTTPAQLRQDWSLNVFIPYIHSIPFQQQLKEDKPSGTLRGVCRVHHTAIGEQVPDVSAAPAGAGGAAASLGAPLQGCSALGLHQACPAVSSSGLRHFPGRWAGGDTASVQATHCPGYSLAWFCHLEEVKAGSCMPHETFGVALAT